MATTNHLAITLVEQSQAQKEITVNSALSRIDAILNCGAVTRSLSTPPGSPTAGAVYIVGASPTGAWASQADAIAYFDQVWRFITPLEGMHIWVGDEDAIYYYHGSAWQAGMLAVPNSIAATSYTLAASDIGKTILFTHASATSFTLPNSMPAHFSCRIIQTGTGQVTFTAGSGATLRSRPSHTKTAGRWAVCHLQVISNAGGSAAEYVLSGDTVA